MLSFSLHAEPGDYTMQSVDLVFNIGNLGMMLCVTIPINDDLLCEGPETLIVTVLEDDQNVILAAPTQATLTILDNDGMYSNPNHEF